MFRSKNETCDDNNTIDGDGCSSLCKIESSFTCSELTANDMSICLPICGDGFKRGEECDDKNTLSGDGCDSSCKIENGFTCTGNDRSTCTPICGDGLKMIGYE